MKILIIGTHRSGSSNLMMALAKIYDLKYIPEPWNKQLNKSTNRTQNNFDYPNIVDNYGVVKSLALQYPDSFNSACDFYSDCKKHFEHIIILGRENRIALAESKAQAVSTDLWSSTYSISKNHSLNLDMDNVNIECDEIIKISSKLRIPITWYEDLYSGDMSVINHVVSKWSLGIETNIISRYLNPKDKLRKFVGGKKTLI